MSSEPMEFPLADVGFNVAPRQALSAGLSVVFTSDLVKASPNQYTQSVIATVAGHQN